MPPFRENALAPHLPLDGDWTFSLAGRAPQTIPVPSAWEVHLSDKRLDGPALYQRTVSLPADWLTSGRRVVFEADAISFHVTVRLNGRAAGEHAGLWSAFQLDVTELARPGRNEIELEVWKPGDTYPLRETLSGFLPDVLTAFGGPWQSLRLRCFDVTLADLRVRPLADDRLVLDGLVQGLAGSAEVRLHLAGRAAAARLGAGAGRFALAVSTAGLARWQPGNPCLHPVSIEVWQDGVLAARADRRVGLRAVQTRPDGTLWLDDAPLHLRGVLDWGWHPDLIRPTPTRAMLEKQFTQARSLGFNLIKLCLFVPDEATFEAADELGMLLWLELPMWLPKVTPKMEALARDEYATLLRRLHPHPSIVVLSLGCELNSAVNPAFLGSLARLAREWLPNALLCDNSGSAEAYGGAATALSDFYDYHFYTDPHFFQPLMEHLDRAYRPAKPWLSGEFCDADTGRDYSQFESPPWWLTDPTPLLRDDYLAQRAHRERLAAAGVTDGGRGLALAARRQATAVRKHLLELTRRHSATGGDVVSGWADTPITTSGMVDDAGELKFVGEQWQSFNGDAVLLLDRERRRRWVGGDRPAYRDPYTWWAGERAELHLLLSNGLGEISGGALRWRLADAGNQTLAEGERVIDRLPAAQVCEVAVITATLEAAGAHPAELVLSVTLDVTLSGGITRALENRWTLWAVPRPRLPRPLPVAGPLRHNQPLGRLDRQAAVVDLGAAPLAQPFLTDALTPEALARVRAGGQGVWWLRAPDDRFTRALPFWREAIHRVGEHALWSQVYAAGEPRLVDMRHFSVATDFALDLAALRAHLGSDAAVEPCWRRFDARQLFWAEYLVEARLGAGRLWVTSLAFAGGLGSQPVGLDANPCGAWLLAQLLAGGAQ
ncbi:MAG: hypothetical protein IT317_23665 [Anaerolineales bacterium]|nr:hypothetical protein [Anaerolineales bacterium]